MGKRIDRVDEWIKDDVSTVDYQIISNEQKVDLLCPPGAPFETQVLQTTENSLRRQLIDYAAEVHLAIISRPKVHTTWLGGRRVSVRVWAIALPQYNGFQDGE